MTGTVPHASDSAEQRSAESVIVAAVADHAGVALTSASIAIEERHLKRPGAWLTAALQDAGVEVIRIELEDDLRAALTAAQLRQFR